MRWWSGGSLCVSGRIVNFECSKSNAMPSNLLFVVLFILGLAGLVTAYFAKRWPRNSRYLVLLLGSGLLILAGYFNPWWNIGEWDDARDVILLVAANAVVIARINKDAGSGRPDA
jgi:peptidoglycan/LPS O-acetylase OafA/YrhL